MFVLILILLGKEKNCDDGCQNMTVNQNQKFNMQWTNGDVYEVIGVDRAYVDRIDDNDLRITHD